MKLTCSKDLMWALATEFCLESKESKDKQNKKVSSVTHDQWCHIVWKNDS